MKLLNITILLLLLITSPISDRTRNYEVAKVDYFSFEKLVKEVKKHRKKRLLSYDEFKKASQEENTIILDTRSKEMYDKKHIKGAIHLNFSDFAQLNLARIIPNMDTKILIYCNNNFKDDQIHFVLKSVPPKSLLKGQTGYSLALNIPTYINLYGYGYKNVYELDEMLSVFKVFAQEHHYTCILYSCIMHLSSRYFQFAMRFNRTK